MDQEKRKKLEDAGWKVSSTSEFLEIDFNTIDIDALVKHMGWNDESRIALMQQFISKKRLDEEFELFLRTKAKEELDG